MIRLLRDEPIGAESIIKPTIVTEEIRQIKAQNLNKLPIMAHTIIDLPGRMYGRCLAHCSATELRSPCWTFGPWGFVYWPLSGLVYFARWLLYGRWPFALLRL